MEIHQRNNNISKDVQLYKIADSSNNQQKIKIVKASPVKNENKGLNVKTTGEMKPKQLPNKPHFLHEKRKIKETKEQSSKDSQKKEIKEEVKEDVEAHSKEKQPPVKEEEEEEKSVKNNSSTTSEELVDKDSKKEVEKSTVLPNQKKEVKNKKHVTTPISPTSNDVTAKSRPKKRTNPSSKKTNRKILDAEKNDPKQSTITQHFQARRSERKTKKQVERETRVAFEERILKGDEANLEIRLIEGKGRGVFSKRPLRRGDLVCEYAGDLISHDDARLRETEYASNPEIGCYMYYFVHDGKKYCVDATKESGRLGRLLNHSKINANVNTRLFPIKDRPYLILVASRDVREDEELLYDYGDRSKTAIESHPWLKL